MQTSRLIAAFQIISCTILFGCEINPIPEDRLNLEVLKVKELVYTNQLEEGENELLKIDTTDLDEINQGAYYLSSAFLYHELGNRKLALSSMSRATELISSTDNESLKAELNLINGFIYEQLILRSEALKSYFQAYDYYRNKPYTDKLFYTLLGIARTSPDGTEYLKLAEELLDDLKSNRFRVLYLNAQAAILSDVAERNKIMLKSLEYFDEHYALKKQINIYSGIALNYQLLDQIDSSYYYLNAAREIIDSHQLQPERSFHFYIIKAYIEARNKSYEQALETLDVLFTHAANEPGILSQAFLRRSLIKKHQEKYTEAYYDLKKYTRLEDEERAKAEKYQLGLLSIQYQVKEKELALARLQIRWMVTIILASLLLALGIILFIYYRKRVLVQKENISSKLDYTRKRLHEQVQRSIENAEVTFSGNSDKTILLDQIKNKSEFETYFDIHHPFFKEKLRKRHPQLSSADLKYCMCIVADLTLYQTALLLQVSKGAVKKGRKKVREQLNIKSLNELTQYLKTVDSN